MESRFETCCQNCGTTDGTLFSCHQCHVISYCSQSCEAADAESHGRVCFVKVKKNNSTAASNITGHNITTLYRTFFLFMDSECFTERIVQQVLEYFPLNDIITDFLRIPHSIMQHSKQTRLVLLAQILRCEDDSRNIFIKDIFGNTLYVIFNLKSLRPFSRWSDLKPNRMICIQNPILHTFANNLVLCISNQFDIRLV